MSYIYLLSGKKQRQPTITRPLFFQMIYELHTRCWLNELSARSGTPVTLASVPEHELDSWARLGFTHIWLMGIWRTGAQAQAHSRQSLFLQRDAAQLLPDFTETDLVASPYAVAGYDVHPDFGGELAFGHFRRRLAERGLKLILDFIPNHTGLDHPWLWAHPEFYVPGVPGSDDSFLHSTSAGTRWIAHGRDPNFPSWRDTAQLDFRNPALRAALIGELRSIANRADGVRCDMAMLSLNDRFAAHWESHPTLPMPEPEFWSEAIGALRAAAPSFAFVAEVYWGCEARLQQLGFDFTYDKELYDHLLAHRAEDAWRHIYERPLEYAKRSVHFLENHDEPRIASMLPWPEHQMAAVLLLGLPGQCLLQEGQLRGATRRAPIQLARRPAQVADPEIAAFYERLLTCRRSSTIGRGEPALLRPVRAANDPAVEQDVVLVQWSTADGRLDLVAVNLSAEPRSCYAPVQVGHDLNRPWQGRGCLDGSRIARPGRGITERGLVLELPPFAAEVFALGIEI